ncbi:hypothetical protein C8J57DRAFT_1086897 [Mycena rebaudengoi]|nr:hypothetical protein C8J57DRAFT_1086897 [Mycena rebaudengoi]
MPPPTLPVLDLLEDTPAWLRDSIKYLMMTDLGCHFHAVLQSLVQLEKAYNYDNPSRGLPMEKRPGEIHQWIRGGRGQKTKKPIIVRDAAKYSEQWNAWWSSLQPKWRLKRPDGRWCHEGEYGYSWDTLDFPGQNGCLSVVAGLFFWGCAVNFEVEGESAEWDYAVQDVYWILDGLFYSLEPVKGKKGKGKATN